MGSFRGMASMPGPFAPLDFGFNGLSVVGASWLEARLLDGGFEDAIDDVQCNDNVA